MQNRPLTIVFAGRHIGRGDFPSHHHRVWELVYVASGSVITVQDRRPINLSTGMVLVNPPGVPHQDVFVRPYELIYLFVEGSMLEGCERVLYDDPDRALAGVFEASLREWDAQMPQRDAMLRSLAAQLEILIQRKGTGPTNQEPDGCLVEVERLLRDSVRTPTTLREVADRVGVSRSWLCAAFQAAHRKSPHQYVTDLRLERALALLRHSSHKIAFVAEECGYASGSHLTHHVRKATGRSPREIREAARPSHTVDG